MKPSSNASRQHGQIFIIATLVLGLTGCGGGGGNKGWIEITRPSTGESYELSNEESYQALIRNGEIKIGGKVFEPELSRHGGQCTNLLGIKFCTPVSYSGYVTIEITNETTGIRSQEYPLSTTDWSGITDLVPGVNAISVIAYDTEGNRGTDRILVNWIPPEPGLSFGVKSFRFTWESVPNATHYRLLENADGVSGFSQVGNDIPWYRTTYEHIVPLYDRINASYILQSCIAADCTDIDAFDIGDELIDAVGYVKASNTDQEDKFSASVSLGAEGKILAIGAPGEDGNSTGRHANQSDNSASNAGAVYVFAQIGDDRGYISWRQVAYLKASNVEAGDKFGSSVSLSIGGGVLAVGAPGEDSSATGINGNQEDNSAPDSGAVYLFTRDRIELGHWEQIAYLKASNAESGDRFGSAVSLGSDNGGGGGNIIAIGAPGEDSNTTGYNGNQADNSSPDSGAVYVFHSNNSQYTVYLRWSQTGYLKASNPDADDNFGASVSIYSTSLAVGAPGESGSNGGINSVPDNLAPNAGAVYLFSNRGSIQDAYIKAGNPDAGDRFGSSVSLDGSSVAIGAPGESSSTSGIDSIPDNLAPGAGAVYLFGGRDWEQKAYIKAANPDASDNFGASVSLGWRYLAVGAPGESSNSNGINSLYDDMAPGAGAAYLFDSRTGWQQDAYIKATNPDSGDNFGSSICIYSDTLAVGAPGESGGGRGINKNQADNSALEAGALYLY